MSEITFNHLALVVDDLDAALDFWCGSLGLAQAGEARVAPAEAVEIAFLSLGDAKIELIKPTGAESGVGKFLAKRGPGMHHVCLEVPDLDTKLKQLIDGGVEVINEAPRERDGRRYAFIHPNSTGGVLLELYQRL